MKVQSRWPIVPLGDVVEETQYGTSLKANEHGVGVPVLRMNNITYSGTFDLRDLKHVAIPDNVLDQYTVRRGDLLFNRTNSQELVGKMGVWNRDEAFAFAGYLVRLRLKPDRADPAFVAAWFNTSDMKTLLRTRAKPSINMSNINATEVLKFPIVLPPLTEQRRIAEVLDKAEVLRAKRRATLAQFDSLTQSLFRDFFGDPATNPKGFPTAPLASLVREDDTINYGVVQPGHDLAEGVPLIRVGDLIEGKVRHSELKRIAPSIEAAYKRSRLRGDEILVSCVGSIGVVGLATASEKGFNIARAVARVPLADTSCRLFIAAYLNTNFVQRYFTKELRTVSQPTLNIKQLSETTIMVPPIEMQHEFARQVELLEKLKAFHRSSLAELDALFASLQHRAFRGEL